MKHFSPLFYSHWPFGVLINKLLRHFYLWQNYWGMVRFKLMKRFNDELYVAWTSYSNRKHFSRLFYSHWPSGVVIIKLLCHFYLCVSSNCSFEICIIILLRCTQRWKNGDLQSISSFLENVKLLPISKVSSRHLCLMRTKVRFPKVFYLHPISEASHYINERHLC